PRNSTIGGYTRLVWLRRGIGGSLRSAGEPAVVLSGSAAWNFRRVRPDIVIHKIGEPVAVPGIKHSRAETAIFTFFILRKGLGSDNKSIFLAELLIEDALKLRPKVVLVPIGKGVFRPFIRSSQ